MNIGDWSIGVPEVLYQTTHKVEGSGGCGRNRKWKKKLVSYMPVM